MIDSRINLSLIGFIKENAKLSVKEKGTDKEYQEIHFVLGIQQIKSDIIWYEVYLHYPSGKEVKILPHLTKNTNISVQGKPYYKTWAKKNQKGNAIIVDNMPVLISRNYLKADPSSLLLISSPNN